jgi:prolyl-tRNA synthetase
MTSLFSQTRREAPADVERVGMQYLIRAGYVQAVAPAVYSALPLGVRALQRLTELIHDELIHFQPQEIQLPLAQPLELWENSGFIPAQTGEAGGRSPLLAHSYLPAVLEVARRQVRSYRQLPAALAHCADRWQTAVSGQPAPWTGRLSRIYEIYSLHASADDASHAAQAMTAAAERFFKKIDLPAVRADSFSTLDPVGSLTEWMFLHPAGERELLTCTCGYAAAAEIAQFKRLPTEAGETPLTMEKVATPHCSTIQQLADFLKIPAERTAKAVFLMADRGKRNEELVFAVVRGDCDLSEAALKRLLNARSLRPATDEEIRAVGATPGYASPVGIQEALVVVDEEITRSPNLVSGANEEGYHLLNVNYGRDYQAALVATIAAACAGDPCPRCGAALQVVRGTPLAACHLISNDLMQTQDCTFVDDSGKAQPVHLAALTIDLSRVLLCLAEDKHDDYGLRLPAAAAPFPLMLVLVKGKDDGVDRAAEDLYDALCDAGLEPLFDDRNERAGVKFNDADLLGIPLRLTVGERALQQGGVELKLRGGAENQFVPLADVLRRVQMILNESLAQ